ncbi:hypothetical protein Tco_1369660, partial [Tanacetum coccineum]
TNDMAPWNGDSGPLLLQAVQGANIKVTASRYVNSRGSRSSDIGVWSSLIGTQISSTKLRRPAMLKVHNWANENNKYGRKINISEGGEKKVRSSKTTVIWMGMGMERAAMN